MRSRLIICCFAIVIFTAGCESHQARIDKLQQDYDQLGQQFQKDCSGEMLNMPAKLSPKCQDEKTKQEEAWKRLEAERAKK
ncbi:MAG: hypothetical protein JSS87_11215 [Acidobacteria bacterium]|jgi:hypothetical protein|uniref:hypothetical protein n=1 Tax=Edaphobacter flagellatus TaxID=1933044 RepID=UPI001DC3EC96|nr:hypothetical protein [Edaphobacter flagellatus]MBS1815436.1 hypothetical protein [Acidobacteriota bacterium]